MTEEDRRARKREYAKRRRAELKAAGIKDTRVRVRSAEQRRKSAENNRRYRAEAKARGEKIAADTWHIRNPEKHRERQARWREANPDKSREYALKWRTENKERYLEVSREAQVRRKSTAWGRIAARVFSNLRRGVLAKTNRASKYNVYLGYTWADLRDHLEGQFTPAMSWENWGDVWELDHIKPVSLFQYESLDDPLFRECWALSNLRPLPREENATKGAKH